MNHRAGTKKTRDRKKEREEEERRREEREGTVDSIGRFGVEISVLLSLIKKKFIPSFFKLF